MKTDHINEDSCLCQQIYSIIYVPIYFFHRPLLCLHLHSAHVNDSDVFPALTELIGNGGREAGRNNRDLGERFLGGGGELRLPWAPIKEKAHEGSQRKLSFMKKEFNTCQWRYEKALRKPRDLNQKEEPHDPHENY